MKINQLLLGFAIGCAMTVLAAMALAPQNDGGMSEQSDSEKMWEAFAMNFGSPGEEHKRMAKSEGEWECEVKWWNAPDAPPQVMYGESEFRMIMDGRYMLEEFEGDFGGAEFEGANLVAYDRFKKKYIGVWIDTMSTGVSVAEGNYQNGVLTMHGSMPDPATGGEVPTRSTIVHHGDDEFVVSMYAVSPEGDFKMMEITYTRDDDNGDDEDEDEDNDDDDD